MLFCKKDEILQFLNKNIDNFIANSIRNTRSDKEGKQNQQSNCLIDLPSLIILPKPKEHFRPSTPTSLPRHVVVRK